MQVSITKKELVLKDELLAEPCGAEPCYAGPVVRDSHLLYSAVLLNQTLPRGDCDG